MDTIYHRSGDFIVRMIGTQTLLVRTAGGTADLGQVFVLNALGVWLLELIDGQRTVGAIRDATLEDTDGDPEVVEADLAAFLGDLLKIGAIAPAPAPAREGV